MPAVQLPPSCNIDDGEDRLDFPLVTGSCKVETVPHTSTDPLLKNPPNPGASFHVVALYNRKGGVSKTTLAHNVSWAFAARGVRVLVVDADPQCDLTDLLLANHVSETFEKDDRIAARDVTRFYKQGAKDKLRNNVNAALQPYIAKNAGEVSSADLTRIRSVRTAEACQERQGQLWFLPGHPELANYEQRVSSAYTSSYSQNGNAPGAWNALLKQTCEQYDIQLVFVDCNPSIGPLNKTIIMSADALICPCAPDAFTHNAVRSMGSLLRTWKQDILDNIDALRKKSSPPRFRVPNKTPRFLGITMLEKSGATGASNSYYYWAQKVEETLMDHVTAELEKHEITKGMVSRETSLSYPVRLLEFRDAGWVAANAQFSGIPIICVGTLFDISERLNNTKRNQKIDVAKNSIEHVQMGFRSFLQMVVPKMQGVKFEVGPWDEINYLAKVSRKKGKKR